ncbi:MAG: glycosyltransferase family 2 protein [Succinivibrio sp.]|nr:glycosyltransferase family 2 protein [Succinivibrio sp.]
MSKVSVLIPVYKTKLEYLKEAIDSILNQSFEDFELVILDDCPNDSREDFIRKYSDNRIRYYKNKENLGISETRNKLLSLANGEYIAIFDHDDISMSNRLQLQVDYLDTHPFVGVVSGQIQIIPKETISKFPLHNDEIKMHLTNENCVPHTAMMIRASVLRENHIQYERQFSPCEDYMLCLRLINCTMFHNLSEVLVRYRDVSGNTTDLQKEKMRDTSALCKCYADSKFPYLFNRFKSYQEEICWIRIFMFIPFMRVVKKRFVNNYYLFGVIPILSISHIS